MELIGIFIITVGSVRAFYHYLGNLLKHNRFNFKLVLFHAMAAGLEFKMAAEILKTVLIQDWNEILIVGAVIFLRALLSVMIHVEMGMDKHFDAINELE